MNKRDTKRKKPRRTAGEAAERGSGSGFARRGVNLITGPSDTGKTRAALEFILRGAVADAPGVFFSFRDTENTLVALAAELGFDLARMLARGQVAIQCGAPDRLVAAPVGSFTLAGLFVRLDAAVSYVGAKRVVLDGLDALLDRYYGEGLQVEPERLAEWARRRDLTVLVTLREDDPRAARVIAPALADRFASHRNGGPRP